LRYALSNRIPERQHQRRRRPRFWLRRLVVLLILLSPLLIWRGWTVVKLRLLPLPAEGSAARVAPNQPTYVLVLGVDKPKDDAGRSDTLMLLRLAPNGQSAEIINIPRDTQVTLPGGKQSKVNGAYAVGGPDLAVDVTAETLGVPRPYYVKVSLEAFEKIVDQIGGVDITVDRHYVYDDPFQDLHINIPAGLRHLDGETALKFVRLRYDGATNDDIARIKRQQQFLDAVRQKLSAPASWAKVPAMIGTMRKYITTNIPEADQLKLAEALYKARGNLHMLTLPGAPNDSTGDWLLDAAGWSEVVRTWSQN